MNDAGRDFLLYGTTATAAPPRLLRAGRLTAEFSEGNLRTIRYDGIEVLRAISYLVRDRDWGTYSPVLSEVTIEEADDHFGVAYTARCDGPDGAMLTVSATIEANSTGQLTFAASAVSPTGFETNRTGFCILHPIVGLAGTPVTVEHTDGQVDHTALPAAIDPWQPFMDMRAISHTVLPGVTAECRMEGDAFEMEDQRNWTDASYKTYVRPLALPWPYQIDANRPVEQCITLTLRDRRSISPAMHSSLLTETLSISPAETTGIMPAIGLVITPDEAAAGRAILAARRGPGAQDLLLHFDPLAGHGQAALNAFAALATAHSGTLTLEIAVPCQNPLTEELDAIAAMVHEAGLHPDAIIVSPSVDRRSTPPGSQWPDCPPLDDVYAAARAAFPDVRLGGGMLSYFTELNRKRVPAEQLDFVTHATNPIVHAADDVSVMQTLEALPFVTGSIRGIYGDKPYRIGPSTIAMRQNPYGGRTMDNPHHSRLPMANTDPRHNGLFGAAFALGYAIRTAEAGLETLTLSALTGPFGLFAGASEPVPEGGLRALAHVIVALASVTGKRFQTCTSSDPAHLLGLLVTGDDGQTQLLLCNLAPQTLTVDFAAMEIPHGSRLTRLDADTAVAAANGFLGDEPLPAKSMALRPYGVAIIRTDSPAST